MPEHPPGRHHASVRHPTHANPLKLKAGRHAQHIGDIIEEEGVWAAAAAAFVDTMARQRRWRMRRRRTRGH